MASTTPAIDCVYCTTNAHTYNLTCKPCCTRIIMRGAEINERRASQHATVVGNIMGRGLEDELRAELRPVLKGGKKV